MLAELAFALEDEITDVLGEVYMEADMGSESTGQFFTPYHLSKMTAGVTIPADVSPAKPLILNEPSTGGGGMIIAAAEILRKEGLNHQRCMEVVAQDLDWKGVYMTYLQLSLLGIKAIVVQGRYPVRAIYRPEELPERTGAAHACTKRNVDLKGRSKKDGRTAARCTSEPV